MKLNYIIPLFLLLLFLAACEKDLSIDLPTGKEQLVVEGHIEQGAPPIVVLTRSVPVFSEISQEALQEAFVHGAQVRVSIAGESYTLEERPVSSLPAEQRQLAALQFGIPLEILNGCCGFTFYVYTTDKLLGETGGSYQLYINHEEHQLSATTTIPQLNPIDSLWTMPHPDPAQDSLVSLWYRYTDPDTLGNSIRYFTKRNSEPFYPGLFSSVFNDELVNGGTVRFPLDRGEPKGQEEIDEELYSYFGKSDTVTVRWAAIDLPHFRFWSSIENEQNSNGSPISSPNITQSNIKGGLGIWGGYGVTYHQIVIE
ncbi:uncharacterized protein DUF4249 [Pontibacter ummariensis]|uniref:DUF4249 domain-containing protein n=1 Tax=Pontibacter ummariensis TaxID=1610492 RepID=A0A239BT13_9BACT|nr:DUF4249 family protein [Pontibacter ummariensis]PRY15636.1 uncharacterized protein DUF4249 [Pontibacter ummariensis]SNS11060.1 protein of unknown function [Pontibacter ummariensis]